jgi:hypothetical protein
VSGGPLEPMLLGAIACASFIAALLFWRYWRSSGDRFFLLLGASFLVEALNRVHMALRPATTEGEPITYLVRLLAYGLILVAIWDKNRQGRR